MSYPHQALLQSPQTLHPHSGKCHCGHRTCLPQNPVKIGNDSAKYIELCTSMTNLDPVTASQLLTSGASTKVCINFLIGCPLLESSPRTCTTTPSLSVAWASTCRIFVWHSLNCSDITFLWISWQKKRQDDKTSVKYSCRNSKRH